MPIIAYSLDFDGCLSNKNVLDEIELTVPSSPLGFQGSISLELELDALVKHNKKFLGELEEKASGYDKTVLFCGSNRQDASTEFLNSTGKIVFFPHLTEIAECIGAEFNPMLLADIYNDLELGFSLSQAMSIMTTEKEDISGDLQMSKFNNQPEYYFDKTKMTLLYAQIHSLAVSNPNENIVFEFYDDKYEILDSLYGFFNAYKDAIPDNITLNLNHYDGNEVTCEASIEGKGPIDEDYKKTIKWLGFKYHKAVMEKNDGFAKPVSDDSKDYPSFPDFVESKNTDNTFKYYIAKNSLVKLANSFSSEKNITNYKALSFFSGRVAMLKAVKYYSHLAQTDCQRAMESLRKYYERLPKEQRKNSTKDKMIKEIGDIVAQLPQVQDLEHQVQNGL